LGAFPVWTLPPYELGLAAPHQRIKELPHRGTLFQFGHGTRSPPKACGHLTLPVDDFFVVIGMLPSPAAIRLDDPSCPQQIVGELLSCSRRVARVEARLQPQRSESPNLGVFWANSNVRSASVQIAEWGRSLSICQPRLPVGVVPLSEAQSRVLMASAWTAWASGSCLAMVYTRARRAIPKPFFPGSNITTSALGHLHRVQERLPMMSASRCSGCRVLHAIDQLLHAVDHWHTSPSLGQRQNLWPRLTQSDPESSESRTEPTASSWLTGRLRLRRSVARYSTQESSPSWSRACHTAHSRALHTAGRSIPPLGQ
jgi:hypothetical protein